MRLMVEHPKENDKSLWQRIRENWPIVGALAFTVVFGMWALGLFRGIVTIESLTASRWAHFLNSGPNEMGDTLAGFVGSLTLIWVVASVVQQSMELRAQRHEFSAMAKAQEAQVRALQIQAEIFKDEQIGRRYLQKEREINVKLENLIAQLCFETSITEPLRLEEGDSVSEINFFYGPNDDEIGGSTIDERIREASRTIFRVRNALSKALAGDAVVKEYCRRKVYYQHIIELLDQILENHDELSNDQRLRLELIGINAIKRTLNEMFEFPIWKRFP